MASKKERNRQERRDKERGYMESFLARLSKASTVAAATTVAKQGMPSVDAMGRLRHTNLIHVLSGIEATGARPPFRVLRDYPLAPTAATSGERMAYADLFKRLVQSGEISTEDADHATWILSPINRRPGDFI